MTLAEETVDVREEADRLYDEVDEIETEIEQVVDEAMELDPPADEEEAAELADVESRYDRLEGQRITKQGLADSLAAHAAEWGGTEFTVVELAAAQIRQIRDEARREADQQGFDQIPDGYLELKLTEAFTRQTPSGAPDPSDVGELPDRIFEWLYQQGNAINTVGSVEMGNSSLSDRMEQRRGST